MGKHSDPVKSRSLNISGASGDFDSFLIIRLIVAILLLAVTLIVSAMPAVLSFILLLAAAAIAGYDVALQAVDAVEKKDFFATPVIVFFVTALSFIINFPREAAALLILYRVGTLLVSYAQGHTRSDARGILSVLDKERAAKAAAILEQEGAGKTKLEATVYSSASLVLKFAIGFAVIFAILAPLVTNLSFRESIHRALVIVLVSTPASVAIAMPLTGLIGLAYSAAHGVIFNNAEVMEKTAAVRTAMLDKNGVFTDENPELVNVQSDILDKDTFMNFVAHAVYYSEQAFAKAILEKVDMEFRLDLISDFVELPGSGVDVNIGGSHVTLANRELYAERGEAVPYETASDRLFYYLMVSGKYIGKLEFLNALHTDSASLVPELKQAGIDKCVLMTEDSREESERLGTALDVDEVFAEFDGAKKLQLIENLSVGNQNLMYLYANGIETHSAAAVDARVSKSSKYADVLVAPDSLLNLPFAIQICNRMRQIAVENAIFAYLIKVILIYLSITGHCNVWFAVVLETAAILATILNSIRVTKAPLVELPTVEK